MVQDLSYRLVDRKYEPMVLRDRSGVPTLMSEVLQLELCLLLQGLRFYDLVTNTVMLTHEESEAARLAAEAARSAAEQLNQRLIDRLRSLGIDPEVD